MQSGSLGRQTLGWCRRNFLTANTAISYFCGRILLLDVGSYNSYPLDPGRHCLLHAIEVSLRLESVAILEDELRHKVTVAIEHPKHHDVDWIFGFNQYWYILWGNKFFEFIIWFELKCFSSKNKKTKPKQVRLLEFLEKLCCSVFPLDLHDLRLKLILSHLVCEIWDVFMHYQYD